MNNLLGALAGGSSSLIFYGNCPRCHIPMDQNVNLGRKKTTSTSSSAEIKCEKCHLMLGRIVYEAKFSHSNHREGLQVYQPIRIETQAQERPSMEILVSSSVGRVDQATDELPSVTAAPLFVEPPAHLVSGATGGTGNEPTSVNVHCTGAGHSVQADAETYDGSHITEDRDITSGAASRRSMKLFAVMKRVTASFKKGFGRHREQLPKETQMAHLTGGRSAQVLYTTAESQFPDNITIRCHCNSNCPCRWRVDSTQKPAACGFSPTSASTFQTAHAGIGAVFDPGSSSAPPLSSTQPQISSRPGSPGCGHITIVEDVTRQGRTNSHATPSFMERILFRSRSMSWRRGASTISSRPSLRSSSRSSTRPHVGSHSGGQHEAGIVDDRLPCVLD